MLSCFSTSLLIISPRFEYLLKADQKSNPSLLGDDYKFVYVGPEGSWTPLHSDVFGSFSWSANVVGTKRWFFFQPGQEKFLLQPKCKDLVYDVRSVLPAAAARQPGSILPSITNSDSLDTKSLDTKVKSFETSQETCHYFEVMQNRGEIIFVPSGWHHQVHNCEDTISINHNWFNSANLVNHIWANLEKALRAVEREISDCRPDSTEDDWQKLCQNLLTASHGMNFWDFFELVKFVAEKRILLLTSCDVTTNTNVVIFDGWNLGRNHAVLDLTQIKNLLHIFLPNPIFSNLNRDIIGLLGKIDSALMALRL